MQVCSHRYHVAPDRIQLNEKIMLVGNRSPHKGKKPMWKKEGSVLKLCLPTATLNYYSSRKWMRSYLNNRSLNFCYILGIY